MALGCDGRSEAVAAGWAVASWQALSSQVSLLLLHAHASAAPYRRRACAGVLRLAP